MDDTKLRKATLTEKEYVSGGDIHNADKLKEQPIPGTDHTYISLHMY